MELQEIVVGCHRRGHGVCFSLVGPYFDFELMILIPQASNYAILFIKSACVLVLVFSGLNLIIPFTNLSNQNHSN